MHVRYYIVHVLPVAAFKKKKEKGRGLSVEGTSESKNESVASTGCYCNRRNRYPRYDEWLNVSCDKHQVLREYVLAFILLALFTKTIESASVAVSILDQVRRIYCWFSFTIVVYFKLANNIYFSVV